ncbi:MAG: hypothetical protein LBI56_02125 [Puniceicoccales bacterium]|jgi:hypothetical protein|nr:hypothetical protein [Puniceicoccales bacterium]
MSDDLVVKRLNQLFADKIITYASPTADHTYKKVFQHTLQVEGNKIGQSFCNAMLKITMKGADITVRKAQTMSENVDIVLKNFYLSVKNFVDVPEQQNLKVDALFLTDVDDNRRAAGPITRSGNIFSKPAYVLGEIQVSEQQFGSRLLSYGSKILGGDRIDLKNNVIPSPVYATGFCMWNCDFLVKGPPVINSNDLEAKPSDKFMEFACCSVFLGKCEKALGNRAAIDEKLTLAQSALKEKVVKFFKDDGENSNDNSVETRFTALNIAEKKVYLWLEFLAFAHLMTETQKNTSLECLGDNSVADKEVFNAAYDAIKFNFKGKSMENIKIEYPDLWGAEEAKIASINVVVTLLEDSIKSNAEGFKAKVNFYANSVTAAFRDEVYKLLEERKVDADALQAFKNEIENQKSTSSSSSSSSSGG